MNHTGRSRRGRRTLPLTVLLTGMALAGIGLTVAGCGGGGAPAVKAPPASSHTAAERAAVMNWLDTTSQMWTRNDFAGLDQVATGQMRTIYLSEERQGSLPANADREAFQLTGLSITVPCHTGSPAVFVAYADTDAFDLWTGMQSVAMVFERTGGLWKLAAAIAHPGGSGWPALCTKGAPPAAPPVLVPGSYTPDLARVLTRAATGVAQTASAASPFAVNDFLAGSGSVPAQFAAWIRQDRRSGVSLAGRFTPAADPTLALPLAGGRGYWVVGNLAQSDAYSAPAGLRAKDWPDGQPCGHAQAHRGTPRDRYLQHHLRGDRLVAPGQRHRGSGRLLGLAARGHRKLNRITRKRLGHPRAGNFRRAISAHCYALTSQSAPARRVAGLPRRRRSNGGRARHFGGQVGRAYCLAEARRPLKNVHGRGRTAGTSLDAAALSMARGASGVWLRAGSRLGLVCRGTVYLLVGYLAFRLALAVHGRTGAPASSAGAVQAAVAPVWGRVPLVLLIAGLAAYALTQLLEAVFRPSRAESATGRWRQRAVSSWGCLLYSVFCLSTARLLVGSPPKQTAQSEQRQDIDVTAILLRTGWGRLLLILVGVIVVAAAVEMGRRSVWLDFRERFTAEHMSRALAVLTRAVGGFGCIARSVVLVLVGFFIIKAAVLSSAKQVKGLDAVFRSVASSADGAWLLALLACGLFCYGLYCLLEARYRDLTPGR